MAINKIDTLKKYRAIIILGEIGALLHDLGKCDGRFLKSKLKDSAVSFNHLEILDYDKNLIKNLKLDELFNKNIATILNIVKDEILKEWNLDQITLGHFIRKHERYNPKRNEKLIGFIQIADRKDSADDRLMPLIKQQKSTYIATPFGMEFEIEENKLENWRENLYKTISKYVENIRDKNQIRLFREKVIETWKNIAKNTIAETRRAANDVTLWDHSYATASIMKVLLIQDILQDFNLQFLEKDDKGKLKSHYKFNLKVLGVGWNTYQILKEAQTLSGIVGRNILTEVIRKRVKTLLEFEIPVGNAMYEDHNFICFLVPENLDLIFEEIKERLISEVVKLSNGSVVPCIELSDPNPYPSKIIVQTLNKLQSKIKAPLALEGSLDKISWVKEWRNVKNREICVECGKRPRMEGRDICEWCQRLRIEGAKASAKKQNGGFEETLWIDEIADESGNVALIYGFIPLERWLDGTLLKTMFIKTIKDLQTEYWDSRLSKKYKGQELRDFLFRDYKTTTEAMEKFIEELKRNNWGGAKILIDPFLSEYSVAGKREDLYDLLTNFSIRGGSDKPKHLVQILTKPSSPSRLSRIWRETLHFANELVNEARNIVKESTGGYCLRMKIEPEFMDGETRKFFEDKRNKYQPYELVELDFDILLPKTDLYWDGEHFNTTLRIENYVTAHQTEGLQQILKEKQEKIRAASKKLINSILKIKIKDRGKDKIAEVKIRNVDFEEYLPFRKIMVSPNRLKILVPANLALKIIRGFLNKYNNKFSKVRGRLSFNLGIAFFKRKFPLFTVMDGVERSIESLSSELNREDGWRRFKVTSINDSEIKVVEIGNDVKEKVSTEFGSWINVYRWNVYRRLGDDSEDLYHPNFIVTNASGDEETYFEITLKEKDVAIVNVKDLDGKIIEIVPNLFDFQFFDSTTRRFDLALPRKHELLGESSPRPYLLEDVEKIIELWNVLNERLTRTQIKKLEYVCANKIKEWELKGKNLAEDSKFKEFTVSSVKNICGRLSEGDKRIIISSILSGMFFDTIELFIRMKSQIGGEYDG